MKLPDITTRPDVMALVRAALAEDVGPGDVTSLALVPAETRVRAVMLTREACVVSGVDVARAAFLETDATLSCRAAVCDGERAAEGRTVLCVEGCARSILTAERVALNFAQRMTGVATLTRQFVDKVHPFGTRILDTRKTTPTLRVLEKHAVLCGGGENHRMGLFDRGLIKDNHRRLWGAGAGGRLDKAIECFRARYPDLLVEIEVEDEVELRAALRGDPDWILLDNMSPEALRRCVALTAGHSLLEASGGITLANIEAVAATGVDAVSLGCLTHSAPSVDLSLEIESVA